jgi:hypothetical protein
VPGYAAKRTADTGLCPVAPAASAAQPPHALQPPLLGKVWPAAADRAISLVPLGIDCRSEAAVERLQERHRRERRGGGQGITVHTERYGQRVEAVAVRIDRRLEKGRPSNASAAATVRRLIASGPTSAARVNTRRTQRSASRLSIGICAPASSGEWGDRSVRNIVATATASQGAPEGPSAASASTTESAPSQGADSGCEVSSTSI